jgi:hypothetical protein
MYQFIYRNIHYLIFFKFHFLNILVLMPRLFRQVFISSLFSLVLVPMRLSKDHHSVSGQAWGGSFMSSLIWPGQKKKIALLSLQKQMLVKLNKLVKLGRVALNEFIAFWVSRSRINVYSSLVYGYVLHPSVNFLQFLVKNEPGLLRPHIRLYMQCW